MTKEEKNQTNEEKNQTSEEKKYFAFISYSHKDKDAAKKLQNFIQGYKIPAKLEDRPDLPKRIGRVFRDEDELAGDELTPQIEEALRNSRYLIVVCSPNSANSKYVNEEIEYFKSLGGETKILPYIIAGKATTDKDPDCCYAPALKENQKKYQIVGGDAQENGAEAASVKLIAGMLKLEFNMLYDRFRKAEKRKRKIVITAITAFALLMAGVTVWILSLYVDIKKEKREKESAYEQLEDEKFKTDKANKELKLTNDKLDLTNDSLLLTKDSLELKNIALSLTVRDLNIAHLSLDETRSNILAENAINGASNRDYSGARRKALEAITLFYSPKAERALRKSWESDDGYFEGFSGNILCVSWSPDGKYLVSGSSYGELIEWNAKKGFQKRTLNEFSASIQCVAYSPDGGYIACGFADSTVVVCDAKNGTIFRTFRGYPGMVGSISWSPDGKYLASGSYDSEFEKLEGKVIILDVKSGKVHKILEGYSDYGNCVCWSPDGKYLASSSFEIIDEEVNGKVILWDTKNWKRHKTLEGHSYFPMYMSYSPDGKYLASVSLTLLDDSPVGEIILWDAKSGKKIRTLDYYSERISAISWSPSSETLIAGAWNGAIILYNTEDGKIKSDGISLSSVVHSVSWSPDYKYVTFASQAGDFKYWILNEEEKYSVLESMPENFFSSELSQDGKYKISYISNEESVKTTGKVTIKDVKTGRSIVMLKEYSGMAVSASWSPDGRYLVGGLFDGKVVVWDTKSGLCVQTFEEHGQIAYSVGFTSDGRKIIAEYSDGKILQWDFPPLDELIEKTKKWAGK